MAGPQVRFLPKGPTCILDLQLATNPERSPFERYDLGHGFFFVGLRILLTNINGREGEKEKKRKERIAYKTSPTSAMFPISTRGHVAWPCVTITCDCVNV